MLTQSQKDTILATVPVLREGGVALTTHFYERLFTHHPELKNLFNMGNQKMGKQQMALAMAVLAYAENIANPGVLMPVVNSIGHKHTSLNITPEQYDIVGHHLLESIKEVLGDAATPAIIEAWGIAYNQLANLMKGHEQGLYDQKKQTTNSWVGFKEFVVKAKVEESSEITSFYLVPKDGSDVPTYLSGQYVSVKLYIPSLELTQIRQYSLSMAPNNSEFRISVKKEVKPNQNQNGIISNFIHDNLQVGQTIELSAPSGVFVLQDSPRTKVLISGGIGQTPLLAMLETLVKETPKDQKIVWIHGARDPKVQAFQKHIQALQNQHPGLTVINFYNTISQDKQNDTCYKGIVHLESIKGITFDNNMDFYLCGPTLFLTKQLNDLKQLGINSDQVFFEEFGPASLA